MTGAKPTPGAIIHGYLLSACMLGAKFGEPPYLTYCRETTATLVRDLATHGYRIVKIDPAPHETGCSCWIDDDSDEGFIDMRGCPLHDQDDQP